jgi:hypothetical protein
MPRSLNAGDAFFAAAQDAVLTSETTAPLRLEMVRILDEATRDFLDALLADGGDGGTNVAGQRALLPGALELGALLGGADRLTQTRLRDLGLSWKELPEDELARALAGNLSPSANGHAGA